MYRAEVRVQLKPGVSDPEGANTRKALELLGFGNVAEVRSVRVFSIDLDGGSEAEARTSVEAMCERLLTNPVIHTYDIHLETI